MEVYLENGDVFYFPFKWKNYSKANKIEYGVIVKKGYDFSRAEITDFNIIEGKTLVFEDVGEIDEVHISNLYVLQHRINQHFHVGHKIIKV